MKSMKKLVTLLLSLVMLCALAMPAMAAETTYTITINGAKNHKYTAYQVFKGVYYKGERQNETSADKEYLSDVQWGDDVDGDAIVTELKASSTLEALRNKFATVNKTDPDAAEKVAYILQDLGNQSAALDEFARIVGKNLNPSAAGKSDTVSDENGKAAISGLTAGYYFVKDTGTIGADEIATKFLVKVVGNATVEIKATAPTIKKEIVEEGGSTVNGTSANVGDEITFKLTANVPDMASFNDYTFTISDTLSTGLTFNENSVEVKIGGTLLTKNTEYTLTPPTITDNTFKIEFKKAQIGNKVEHNTGATIVVTYNATLNENALTKDKETNTATLKYSNNPAGEGTGTVKTPDVPVYIYDFDIGIYKYDDTDNKEDQTADKTKKLAGAEFILYKEVTEGSTAVKYYYQWDDTAKKVEWTTDNTQAALRTTGADGKASFKGIAAGNYFLEETKAPDGYNKLKDPVPVAITASYDGEGKLTSTSATINGESQLIQTVEVPNKAGAVLPSTGGIGTTIFYVLGSILALGAAVLLIAKKRMNGQDR